ncbi:MAG: 1-deoxy-D-xylulose-5-phosphate synthase [Gracilibacteraceae bacterium]|nr:1-deoxy-D-xylulose-5-phosphate synthase [Gracilibacteraceae bacterium]
MIILNAITSPGDVRALRQEDLAALAAELREEIIGVTAENGGHLASSLGVVELTIALLREFEPPADSIVWDVGHQAYAWKLLTGRRERFATLRQPGGLAGFPRRDESPCDAFGAGHSSTSISAALGFAKARDIQREGGYAVAVIGDGSMSAGMAYEALNHAGAAKTNLIVVLNDNEMFISKHVGAMSKYLNRLRTASAYTRGKSDVKAFLRGLPLVGETMSNAVRKAKNTLKYFLLPGMLFEEMGFTYIGPIDGHDIAALTDVFAQAKKQPGPVLVHAVTRKGMGYEPAMRDPDVFHGVGPFDRETGEPRKKNGSPTYSEVFGETLCRLGQDDQSIVAVTAAMGNGTGLDQFGLMYPRRFFDVGIAEQHAVTFAAGLALAGLKPVVSMYSTFYQRAYDQVLHDVCLQNAQVVFAVDRAGLVGEDGPTHHGVFDIALFRAIPNLTIMAPKDENELRHMLRAAFTLPNPAALRYPRGKGRGDKQEDDSMPLPVGKAELMRQGADVVLIGFGPLVYRCMEAADELARRGVDAGVLNLRFLNPTDQEAVLREARRTGRVVTVEDHMLAGGVGSAVLEILADAGLSAVRVKRLGYGDYVTHGPIDALLAENGLDTAGITRAALDICAQAPA